MNSKHIHDAITAGIFVIIVLVGFSLYGLFGPGLPLSVNSITTNKNDVFSVTGEGRVSVKPDIAEVNFGVATTGQTVAVVQSQSNEAINKVVEEIKKLGIADADIKTTNYNIYPQYDTQGAAVPLTVAAAPAMDTMAVRDIAMSAEPVMVTMPAPSGRTPRITGYGMNVNIVVTVRDLTKVNQVIDTATANGANQVSNISFTVDDEEKYQAEARKLAIDDAKSKANELAGAAGLRLGKVVGVYESPVYYGRDVMMSAKAEGMGGAGSTALQPGSTEIATQVTLNYETR